MRLWIGNGMSESDVGVIHQEMCNGEGSLQVVGEENISLGLAHEASVRKSAWPPGIGRGDVSQDMMRKIGESVVSLFKDGAVSFEGNMEQ